MQEEEEVLLMALAHRHPAALEEGEILVLLEMPIRAAVAAGVSENYLVQDKQAAPA
jgi:hypothetical protein